MELKDWMSALGSLCTRPVMQCSSAKQNKLCYTLRWHGNRHDTGKVDIASGGSGLHDVRAFVDRHISLHFQWQDWSNMYISVYQRLKKILEKLGMKQEGAREDQC